MKQTLSFLFCLVCAFVVAQKTPEVISGQVYIDSIPTQDVHIINKKMALGAVSNENGFFEILASKGDNIIISHLNVEYKEYSITALDMQSKRIQIHLLSKNYMLDEIVLKKKKGIFDVDADILPHNAPIVNAKTLKLPYANSKKPKKDKTFKIRSGMSVSLSGLINSLNGNNRREKLLKKIKSEDENLSKIRKHFSDGFFTTQLKIKKENINIFLENCVSKGIINLYNKDKLLELTAILIENSKNSPYLIEKEYSRITQK